VSASVFFSSASELATISNTFTVDRTATDPTTISLVITDPDGDETTYTYAESEITRTGPGAYRKDITCDNDGTWTYEWVGTGAAVDTEVGTWDVQETQLGHLYCPVSTLKSRLSIDSTEDDDELHAACFAASRWIETHCDRVFWRSLAEARTFEPNDCHTAVRLPAFCDLVSASSVKTDTAGDGSFATTLTGGYRFLPGNPGAAPEWRPYDELVLTTGSFPVGTQGRLDTVQITGVWGWPKVPPAIRTAARIIAADTFRLKDSPFGVAGEGDFTVQVGENARALKFLKPYRRDVVLVG